MQKWKEDFLFFCKNRIYMLMLSLTAVFGYGFLITHQTVGIDDTPYTYYFEEGLNVIVGRWFLFVLNKVFRVADFSPFITDLAGVLILMLAVTVWCTLIYSVCREKVPVWGYTFFACVFLSCPLISEVYPYYLHNAVSVGYLSVGISLCFFKELTDMFSEEGRQRDQKGRLAKGFRCGLGAVFFLFVALGCYESFMIVWLVGLLMLLFLMRSLGRSCRVIPLLGAGAVAAVLAILIRGLMIEVCVAVFDLGAMRDEAVQRSVGEMLGWVFGPGAGAEFAMALKRTYVMYFAFAYAYYPIKIFVWASIIIVLFALWRSIRRKDVWPVLLAVGIFIAAFLLVLVEGSVTLYRAAQFLPLICGLGALLLSLAADSLNIAGKWKRLTSGVCIFALGAVLWNQCFDMNHWFYVDWLKYEDAREVVNRVAEELEADFDLSKPVVFTGGYQVPKSIIADAYVDYNTETYFKIKKLTDLLDKDLLDKFNRGDYGVWVAQTPALSVIDWGMTAFDGTGEMATFFSMHGHTLQAASFDLDRFEELQTQSADLPHFPAEGSIVDRGDFIVVHF